MKRSDRWKAALAFCAVLLTAAVGRAQTTADLSVTDGDEAGPVGIVFTVTLDSPNETGSAITFDLDDDGTGSATSGSDYTAIAAEAQISVAVGASTGTLSVAVTDDALLEATETVDATISNPSNASVTIGTASATADIADNDTATANLSVTTDGDEAGPVDIVFTVTLDKTNDTGSAITFDLGDDGTGSATSGSDYTAIAAEAQISVADGASTGTLSVAVTDDALLEATETVDATISNSSNASVTIGTASATADIADNDSSAITVEAVSQTEGSGLIFTVTLDNAVQGGFTVDVTLTDVTATGGGAPLATPEDYDNEVASLSFAGTAGETKMFTVATLDDALEEGDETFTVSLDASNALVTDTDTATGTIVDNDADLSVTKDDGVTTAVPGETTTYTIVVSNPGPTDTTTDGVSVADTFPADLSCGWTSVAAGGATGNTSKAGPANLEDTLTMPAGSSVTYTVTCTIASGATGTLSNTVTATAIEGTSDPNTDNNSATDDDTVLGPEADLSIDKTDSPDPVIVGQTLIYTVTVTNNGPSDALGVVVTDTLPGDVTLTATGTTGCTEDPTGVPTCTLGTIAAEGMKSYTIEVLVDAEGVESPITNEASVASSTPDPDTGDNATTEETTVIGDLSFSKRFVPGGIISGGTSRLIFTIDNTGNPAPVGGLSFTDTLPTTPAAMTIETPAGATTSCGGTVTAPAGGSTIIFSGGTVAANSTCTVEVDVTATENGNYTNISSQLTSDAGTEDPAMATLAVGDFLAFSKAFSPSTIGPGSSARLTFSITNTQGGPPAEELTFTDSLPAGMTLASPAVVSNGCSGNLSAPVGGTSIMLTDGRVGAGGTCAIAVNVVATATGMNTSGDLESNLGNSGSASATLTVDTGRPGFSKSFAPGSIPKNGLSTLTFLIDNSANAGPETFLSFTDNLPPGVVVAAVPNASTTCAGFGSTLTANPGSSTISFFFGSVAANSTCTVSVDVTATANGSFGNVSGELTLSERSSGFATDTLEVARQALNKVFTNDPARPGDTVTLEFTLQNPSRTSAATGLTFDDDLESVLTGLAPSGMLPTDPCGAGSSLSFSMAGVLTLSGGSLAAEGSCTFSVTLLVPSGASPGAYGNTTTALMGTIDGEGFTGNTASDVLFVTTAPRLTKEFIGDPVGAGGTVTLRFTITNVSSATSATGITFTDDLDGVLTGLAPSGLPPLTPCGTGSTLTFSSFDGILTLTGGTLAAAGMAGDSCTFDVSLSVPKVANGGVFPNTTSAITATVDGGSKSGLGATDNLTVVGAPSLRKEFTDDPVAPGGTVTLQFTLSHRDTAVADATGIGFMDDLTTLSPAVSGLTATSVPSNTCAGSTVDISTPTLINVSGASLMPGASCVISVTLSVPGGTTSGSKSNTTSDVTATVGGVGVTGNPAQDSLRVSGLILTKKFMDTPAAIPGGTVVLRFTLVNSEASAATSISFSDDVDANLPGLSPAAPLPSMPCGGSLIDVGNTLSFSGGSVAAMSSCFFDVTLDVPATITNPSPPPPTIPSDGEYGNTTSAVSYSGGTADPAFDTLTVDSELLALTKSFTDDPTVPGGTVTLEIKVENLDTARAASAIAFSDDLGAALAGLTINSLLFDDCGGTVSGVGTTMLSYSGGSLAAGGMCTLRLSLDVPAGPLPGSTFTNTTSAASGTIAGLPVTGAAASDDLRVFTVTFAKAFSKANVVAGESLDLTFTLTNLDSSAGVSDLAFSDNLPAGLMATVLPPTPCGAGSTISGSTFLTFSNGSLGPSGICMFTVTLQVPTPAIAGSFVNTTSQLLQSGLPVAGAASAPINIVGPPLFSKVFSPDPVGQGFDTTLTFTINNMAGALPASDLDFLDMLPVGLEVAPAPMTANTCGGDVMAPAGGVSISLSNGTVAAGATCTLSIKIRATGVGLLTNTTSDLTSSSGNSGTASDTVTVIGCLAADGANLTLGSDVVLGTEIYKVCNTIRIEQHYQVLGPSGVLHLTAGVAVIIFDGVEFGQGSEVSITIDPSLIP